MSFIDKILKGFGYEKANNGRPLHGTFEEANQNIQKPKPVTQRRARSASYGSRSSNSDAGYTTYDSGPTFSYGGGDSGGSCDSGGGGDGGGGGGGE